MILFLLLGAILGAMLLGVGYIIYDTNLKYKTILTPIYKFLEMPISEVTFDSRKGHLVTLIYNQYIIYLSIQNKEVYISENGDIKYVIDKLNKRECMYLYDRLYTAFDTEININVVDYNGVTVSTNIFKDKDNEVEVKSYEYTPNLDDILDKISEHGIDSLTKFELDILHDQSEK